MKKIICLSLITLIVFSGCAVKKSGSASTGENTSEMVITPEITEESTEKGIVIIETPENEATIESNTNIQSNKEQKKEVFTANTLTDAYIFILKRECDYSQLQCKYVSLDISKIADLTDIQKSAIINEYKKGKAQVLTMNYEELDKGGYLTGEKEIKNFENGVKVGLSTTKKTDNSYYFEISEWSGSLCGSGTEGIITYKNGKYEIEYSLSCWNA